MSRSSAALTIDPVLAEVPVFVGRIVRPEVFRQQIVQQVDAEPAGFPADLRVAVLEHNVVLSGLIFDGPRTTEADMETGRALQFEDDVFEHMTEPGALVLSHAAHESPRGVIRTGVLAESGERRHQSVNEPVS